MTVQERNDEINALIKELTLEEKVSLMLHESTLRLFCLWMRLTPSPRNAEAESIPAPTVRRL